MADSEYFLVYKRTQPNGKGRIEMWEFVSEGQRYTEARLWGPNSLISGQVRPDVTVTARIEVHGNTQDYKDLATTIAECFNLLGKTDTLN